MKEEEIITEEETIIQEGETGVDMESTTEELVEEPIAEKIEEEIPNPDFLIGQTVLIRGRKMRTVAGATYNNSSKTWKYMIDGDRGVYEKENLKAL